MLSEDKASIPLSSNGGVHPALLDYFDTSLGIFYQNMVPSTLIQPAQRTWCRWQSMPWNFFFFFFLNCIKPEQNKNHLWKCPISVKAFQTTARSSSTLLHRADSPIVTWQLMKVVARNINRFEVYFCQ